VYAISCIEGFVNSGYTCAYLLLLPSAVHQRSDHCDMKRLPLSASKDSPCLTQEIGPRVCPLTQGIQARSSIHQPPTMVWESRYRNRTRRAGRISSGEHCDQLSQSGCAAIAAASDEQCKTPSYLPDNMEHRTTSTSPGDTKTGDRMHSAKTGTIKSHRQQGLPCLSAVAATLLGAFHAPRVMLETV